MNKLKIVHVIRKMDRGGVEVWLKDIFDNIDRTKYEFIFLSTIKEHGFFDEYLLDKGAKIEIIPLDNFFVFCIKLFFFLKKNKIQVIHSHLLNFSGFVLMTARFASVPIRISHSHSDKSVLNRESSIARKIYLKLTYLLLNVFATYRLACSEKAGLSLYNSSRFKIINNGVDLSKFSSYDENKKSDYYKEFLIPNNVKVIGHVGRFSYPKNHTFLIDVAIEVVKLDKNFIFILVGEGEMKQKIEQKVLDNGLSKNFRIIGGRDDVPSLMSNLFDVFLFPSLYEGMPISLIETQKAGLMSVISNSIPYDVIEIERLFNKLSLNDSPSIWAKKIIEVSSVDISELRSGFSQIMDRSKFTIQCSIEQLQEYYKR